MDYQLGSEQLGYHSEILEYLEQVQEEAQRHSQKTKGSISSFRLEKGSGPYKKWESKPLCDQNEEEASTSGEEDDDRDVREGRSRTDSCLQALFWINGGLLLVVIIVGTAVGMHGQAAGQQAIRSPQVLGISGRQDLSRASLILFPMFGPVSAPAPAPSSAGSTLPFQTKLAAGGAARAASASHAVWAHDALAGRSSVSSSAALSSSSAPLATAIAAADYWQRQGSRDARASLPPPLPASQLGGFPPAMAPAPVSAPMAVARLSTPQGEPFPSVQGLSMDKWSPFFPEGTYQTNGAPRRAHEGRAKPRHVGSGVKAADDSDLLPPSWMVPDANPP